MSLPEYTVRTSARAKRISVTVRPGRGVEVVLPRCVGRAAAEEAARDVVRRKRAWIERALRRLGMSGQGDAEELPHTISLNAVGLDFQVGYDASGRGRLRLTQNQGRRLQFLGRPGEREEYVKLLASWLADRGREHLPPLLKELAEEAGLTYGQVRIRRQQTRWGSCTAKGSISLNCKILFFPAPLARHVLLHELAHTMHLDHSTRFWALVARLDPQWHEHDRALRGAGNWVPWWAHR